MSAPQPGMPAVVVLRTPVPTQWQGEVVALRDASVAVRVSGPPAQWNNTLPYLVICGSPGSRLTASASFVANNGSVAAFKLTSRWAPLDMRRDQRFATDLMAEVRSVLGNSRQQGRVIDISLGGAAVATDSRPGGSQVEINVAAHGYSARILCDVMGSSASGDETILHLRFRDLSPPQQAFIRQLVGWLVETRAQAS